MKKLTLKNCVNISAAAMIGLTLSACTELPTEGGQTVKFPNPLKVFTQPLKANTTTVSAQPTAKNYNLNAKTTATAPQQVTLTQPTTPRPIAVTNPTVVTNRVVAQPVARNIQGMQVRTSDGQTVILYPGQTYYGPDGRLYIYDPQTLPVVTAGY